MKKYPPPPSTILAVQRSWSVYERNSPCKPLFDPNETNNTLVSDWAILARSSR